MLFLKLFGIGDTFYSLKQWSSTFGSWRSTKHNLATHIFLSKYNNTGSDDPKVSVEKHCLKAYFVKIISKTLWQPCSKAFNLISNYLIFQKFSDFPFFSSDSCFRNMRDLPDRKWSIQTIDETGRRNASQRNQSRMKKPARNFFFFKFFSFLQESISLTFYKQLFCMKVMHAACLCLQYGFDFFWQKEIAAKAANKMLVKLTTILPNFVFIRFRILDVKLECL